MKGKNWLIYALMTTFFWGIWGAFIEFPERRGFPATLGFCAWAISMIPCSVLALYISKQRPDIRWKSVALGLAVGLTGAGGQILLFQALAIGPAYLIFPIISLYPMLTIVLSTWILREHTNMKGKVGIVVALIAIFLLSTGGSASTVTGYVWLGLSSIVFIMWGLQAFVMKFSNERMTSESIFFYMMLSGILTIPFALMMTDFDSTINWGFTGAWSALLIHSLNSIGALALLYALRHGKAIIVVPLTGLSPVITILLSLLIYAVIPTAPLMAGMVLAVFAMLLLSE